MIENKNTSPIAQTKNNLLVTRSLVEANKKYPDYKKNLRYDFFHSCAYCTMSESEAQAIRFCIDHYEPREARPDLINAYENLMYSCEECNLRKGNRCPPENARSDGLRFFRPDHDIRSEHFTKLGNTLTSLSNIGRYSIISLDLNRASLKKLRSIRDRLTSCEKFVAEGIMALRNFKIDQIPKDIRSRALDSIKQAASMHEYLAEQIDNLLRESSKSALIEMDIDNEEEKRNEERLQTLRDIEAVYPGKWRAGKKMALPINEPA